MKHSNFILFLQLTSLAFSLAGNPLQINYDESDPHKTMDFEGLFQKQFRVPEPKFRLFHSIIPTNYNLRIRPILDDLPDVGAQWTAPGSVVISVDCVQATNNITLHSRVAITESSVKVILVSTGAEVPYPAFDKDADKEFFIISFPTPLLADEKYQIFIDFVADIGIPPDRYDGLYRSHYVDPAGVTKYLATTQFQAFGARRAFPCFDEPGFKATFDTTIGYLFPKYNAVSNTPVNEIKIDPEHANWVWAEFDQTVKMPTYLVAMVISDFTAATADESLYHKVVQTIGPKHFIDAGLGDYTAEIAAKDLKFFEEYFVEEYSLEKMDSAALVDFAAGAMENWGLNTYREAYLLYSKEDNTENERRGISSVIAHELAHQWFGNLITCRWWDDTWLNEGFASYIQYLGMLNATPEFDPMKVRLPQEFQTAMRSDVLEGAHPMRLPDKESPYDTMSYMSALVYNRGSAVIRMMEQFLTEKTLQAGLRKFLKEYSFQPVEQDQLFEILNQQAHEDNMLPEGMTIKDIMDTWTLQRGYPVLRVTKAGSSRIYISQEKFVSQGQELENFQWYVPVAVATQDNPDFSHAVPEFWMTSTTLLTNRAHDTTKWILLNAGATGYYRVLYDDPLTVLIRQQLMDNHEIIDHGSRSQLFDDYFNFGFEGYTSINHALDFTKYLGKEKEFTVWTPVLFHLRKMYNLYIGDDFESLKKYLEPKINDVLNMEEMGLEQKPEDIGNVVLFRAQLLDWACGFQHTGCVDYAVRQWTEWKVTPADNKIPIDLRPVLYCAAIRAGGQDDIDFAIERYTAIPATNLYNLKQKQYIINALGCAQQHLLNGLLEKAIDPTSGIEKSDATGLVRSVAGNLLGRGLTMDFFESNIDQIIDYMGEPSLISGAITTISTYYFSDAELERILGFITAHEEKLKPVENSLNTSLANIRANGRWMTSFFQETITWFRMNA